MSQTTYFSGLSPTVQGGVWMTAGALSFTIMTTLIREVAQNIHPFEIGFFRCLTNLLCMLPFVFRTGSSIWQSVNHKVYIFRGVIGVGFLLTFFPGAAMLPVSDSMALFFTAPLFGTILVLLFLGERIHTRRIAALIVGFCGALIILRPGFDEVNIGSLLILLGALFTAASSSIIKYATRTDHPDKVVFYLMLYATPLILVPALMYWTTPTLSQGALMVGVGLLATLNQRFMSRAFAAADATAMFPFEFIRLPFAALIGWLAFSELPDIWVWIGGAVIFASSAYIAHREAQVKRLQK